MTVPLQSAPVPTTAPHKAIDLTVVRAFRNALDEAHLQEKVAADLLRVDPSQLSRALAGDGNLHVERWAALGPRFIAAFLANWAEAEGLRVVVPDASTAAIKALVGALADALKGIEAHL